MKYKGDEPSRTNQTGSAQPPTLHPAIVNLRDHHGQLDEDGICVAVSRQAVEETLAITSRLIEALGWFVFDPRYDIAVGGNPVAVQKMINAAKAVYVEATYGSASDRVTDGAEGSQGRLVTSENRDGESHNGTNTSTSSPSPKEKGK